jgi:hypothetical protein
MGGKALAELSSLARARALVAGRLTCVSIGLDELRLAFCDAALSPLIAAAT